MALTIGTAIVSATAATATAAGATAVAAGATAVATSTLATAAVGTVALTGALLGVQALANATAGQLKTTVNIKQALAPRVRVYGRTMLSGAKAFESVRNGNLYQAIMLASDQIDAVEQYYIGEIGVAVVNNLVQTAPWSRSGGSSYIGFDVHLGLDNPGLSTLITNAFPEAGNFQLAGIAHVGVVMLGTKAADFQKTYPQGPDTLFRFVVRGALVYDPRDAGQNPTNKATWHWSQNASLCIRDFLVHRDGLNLPLSYIDDASFAAFADVCDQPVPLKAGGTEPRYQINGSYDLSEEPKTVLARMCAACDGQLIQTAGGRVGITGGVWVPPSTSITSDHILDGGFEQGAGAFDAYNRLTATFASGFNYFQMTEIAPLNDAASQAIVGVVPQTLPLPMVTSYTQAARLAKIAFAKSNPQWKGACTTDMTGLAAVGDIGINLTYAPVPYAAPLFATSFLVTSLALGADLASVDFGLSSLTADAYAWNPATEEPDAPKTPQQISNYNTVDPPANAHASITKDPQSDGTLARIGHLTWDPSTRADASPVAQYRVSGSGNWVGMTIGGDGASATTPALMASTAYDFEVAFTAAGAASTESVVANVTAPA